MDQDPDLDLVRVLRAGTRAERQAALAGLYDRHGRRVFNVAWRVLGDPAAAEDVAQEIFLGLERSVRSFRSDASFVSWVYRITVNRAIDVQRRDARRPATRMGEMPAGLEESGLPGRSAPGDPVGEAERSEVAARVQAALLRLSPKLRAIAVLRYVEGLSYEDLAEVLACSMGTVKSRLSRAHAALAAELGPYPPGQGAREGGAPG
jgi:RNA polymerase sigma-70 factor (ECF subfamily)